MLINEDKLYELAEAWVEDFNDEELVDWANYDADDILGDMKNYLIQEEIKYDDEDVSNLACIVINVADNCVLNKKEDSRQSLKLEIGDVIYNNTSPILNDADIGYVLVELAEIYLRPKY